MSTGSSEGRRCDRDLKFLQFKRQFNCGTNGTKFVAGIASFDCEKSRFVDRIHAIAFREARDAGVTFIDCVWVARKLKSSVSFVANNWNRNPFKVKMNVVPIGLGNRQMSDSSEAIIAECAGKRKRSVRQIA